MPPAMTRKVKGEEEQERLLRSWRGQNRVRVGTSGDNESNTSTDEDNKENNTMETNGRAPITNYCSSTLEFLSFVQHRDSRFIEGVS
jgi:hypothetical protein